MTNRPRPHGAPDASSDVVRGAVVLVTGGARGMGELYCRYAAQQGARAVAVVDLDTDRAQALCAQLRDLGADARAYRADVGDRDAVGRLATQVQADLGTVDILVNNAGIVRGALFWEHDPERDIEAMLRVNTLGPMWLTRALLPAMLADRSRPRRILTVASAAGTLPNPRMSVYAASKWAAIGWSESLRLELARSGHDHVAVTTFCPGYVSTGMFEGARGPLLTPVLTPEVAATAAWDGMRAGRPIVSRPWTVTLGKALRGTLPTRVFDVVADRVFGVYSSMDAWTGRPSDTP